jgi:hypothetical protein
METSGGMTGGVGGLGAAGCNVAGAGAGGSILIMLVIVLAPVEAGFRMKGASSGSGMGSGFFTSAGTEAWGGRGGETSAAGPGGGEAAFGGAGSGLGAGFSGESSTGNPVVSLVASGSGTSRFNMRMLPVWLRVRTGSASAINCSMFLRGSGERWVGGSAPVAVASRAGGRRTTP